MADQAFVTCATNDTYALGALVLAYSLRNVQTSRKVVAIVTEEVSDKIREQLQTVFDVVQVVNVLDSRDEANLALLTRPDLGVTFTKFHCWRLTQFSKCVFLDADIVVLQNCDELFDREELSAVPDVGWPDCFNSGVFVYRPNEETYRRILAFAIANGSFDGGDQGVLNMYFSDWRTADIAKHLSFIYNMNANVTYTYLPAYKQFGKDVKIVHFLGAIKPWMQYFNSETGRVEPSSPHAVEHLQLWWDIFMKHVQPNLSQECRGLAGDLARLHLSSGHFTSSEARQHAWERGQIDYMGADAFENIEKKLQSAIAGEKEAKVEQMQQSQESRVPEPAPVSPPAAVAPAPVSPPAAVAPVPVSPPAAVAPVPVSPPAAVAPAPVSPPAATVAPAPVSPPAAAVAQAPASAVAAAPMTTTKPATASTKVAASAKPEVSAQPKVAAAKAAPKAAAACSAAKAAPKSTEKKSTEKKPKK